MQEEGNNEKQAIGREELMKGEEVKEDEIKGMEEDKVLLQVNGKLFSTTRSKILRQSGTFFEAMLGSGLWEPNESGIYVIERDDTYFHLILDYLENGDASIFKELTREEREILNVELDYYQVKLLTWDAKRCTSDIATFSDDNLTVKIRKIEGYHGCAIATFRVEKFTVEIENSLSLDVGFIADETKISERLTHAEYDCYLYNSHYALFHTGYLYGNESKQSETWNNEIALFRNGDVITFAIEKSTIQERERETIFTIHIYKNGEDLGAAWIDIKVPILFPFVAAFSRSPSCTIIN